MFVFSLTTPFIIIWQVFDKFDKFKLNTLSCSWYLANMPLWEARCTSIGRISPASLSAFPGSFNLIPLPASELSNVIYFDNHGAVTVFWFISLSPSTFLENLNYISKAFLRYCRYTLVTAQMHILSSRYLIQHDPWLSPKI